MALRRDAEPSPTVTDPNRLAPPVIAADHPIDWGDLRRVEPVDAHFGLGRGLPVDRHYIETFLEAHRDDVRGTVLEVADDHYTRRFGAGRVTRGELLHRDGRDCPATWVADLADGAGLPSERFDCFICTQTLQYVFDLAAAFSTLRRILRPGGVLLLSVPGISQISVYDRAHWGEHWRFTPQSVERLLSDAGFAGPQVEGHGNVLAAVAFLQGLATSDLTPDELAVRDDRYPFVVTARAVRPA